MYPKIQSFKPHRGSPAISKFARTPGYWINGKGFGQKRGQVEIDGETYSVVSWSPTFIEVDRPSGYARDCVQVIVTTAGGRKSQAFIVDPIRNPYDGYVRPQDRRAKLRRAA
jgi:hypothetical protein